MDTNNNDYLVDENIITIFGLNKLSPEERVKHMSEIGEMLLEEIVLKGLALLNEKDQQEYDELLKQNPDPSRLLDLFFEKIPNFMEIIETEKSTFISQSKALLVEVKKQNV